MRATLTVFVALLSVTGAAHARPPSAPVVHSVVVRPGNKSAVALPSRVTPDAAFSVPKPSSPPPPTQLEARIANAAVFGGYLAVAVWARFAWYAGQDQSDSFVVLDEGWFGSDTYAGGADKLGHFYSCYLATRMTVLALRKGGFSPTARRTLASVMTMAFFTGIEVKDAYHLNYGFSWSDMVANTLGTALGVAMQAYPALDRWLDVRLEYFPSAAYLQRLRNGDPNVGEDYSGMNYALWLKLNAVAALRQTLARYIDVGVGFGTIGYKPGPQPQRRQELSLRISLNATRLVDDAFEPRSRTFRWGALRFLTEMVTIPGTSAGVTVYQADAE